MQLRAIHKTTKVFKDFTRQHDLDRVEKLQDELENGMERVMEVHDTLVQDTIDVDESDLESELNDLLLDMPEAPDSPLTHSSTHTPTQWHLPSRRPFSRTSPALLAAPPAKSVLFSTLVRLPQ